MISKTNVLSVTGTTPLVLVQNLILTSMVDVVRITISKRLDSLLQLYLYIV